MCPLACVRTSVGKTWQLEASRYSLGWVSCSQLSLSASSVDDCCIWWPPTWPSPASLLLRLVWSCSPPTCTLTLSLRLSCGPLSLDSLGGLHAHSRGCPCVPGPSVSQSQYLLRKWSSHSSESTWLEVALAQAAGALFVEWPLASLSRRLPLSLPEAAAYASSSLTPSMRVRLPTALHHGPPFVSGPGGCGRLSNSLCACTLRRLLLCRCRIATRPSTTSRPLHQLWPLYPSPSGSPIS